MRLTPALAAVAVAAVALVAGARSAAAYPEYQLSTGSDRCTACHYSPAGGGLINDFGRSEAGDTLSRGGNGAFLHGLWEPPEWLQLGADVRLVAGLRHLDSDRETLLFPMQGDVYVRAGGDTLSFNATVGLRAAAREPRPSLVERLASREHYLMWKPRAGSYLRAGRFFPVFGLRMADHTAMVRRYLGFHTLEEPYGLGGGIARGAWEAHATVFTAPPVAQLGAGVEATGAAVYAERRVLDETATIAGQARVAVSEDDGRALVGVVGKRWFESAGLMVMAELDLQRQWFAADRAPTRYQLAYYLGAQRSIVHGVQAGLALHRWQPDLTLRSSRDAVDLNLQYFPMAHLELHLLGRASASGNDLDEPGLLAFLQLHYYL